MFPKMSIPGYGEPPRSAAPVGNPEELLSELRSVLFEAELARPGGLETDVSADEAIALLPDPSELSILPETIGTGAVESAAANPLTHVRGSDIDTMFAELLAAATQPAVR